MQPNVLPNDLVGNVSRGRDKIPTSPKMAAPIQLAEMFELHQQLTRRLSLHVLHDLTGRQVRRSRHQDMDMVFANVPLQNLDFVGPADLTHQIPQADRNRPHKNGFAVLCCPHKMKLDVKTRVSGCSPFEAVYLKVSPEGEGFNPIERQSKAERSRRSGNVSPQVGHTIQSLYCDEAKCNSAVECNGVGLVERACEFALSAVYFSGEPIVSRPC